MPNCDIGDMVSDCVNEYLDDYDWSEVEKGVAENAQIEVDTYSANALEEFEKQVDAKVSAAINNNQTLKGIREYFDLRFGNEISDLKREINSLKLQLANQDRCLDATDDTLYAFTGRGFFGRIKWLLFGA